MPLAGSPYRTAPDRRLLNARLSRKGAITGLLPLPHYGRAMGKAMAGAIDQPSVVQGGKAVAMTAPSLSSSSIVRHEHRGWTLYIRWYHSFWGAAEGWVCKAIPPGGAVCDALSIGRHRTSADAVASGTSWIDRKLSIPVRKRSR